MATKDTSDSFALDHPRWQGCFQHRQLLLSQEVLALTVEGGASQWLFVRDRNVVAYRANLLMKRRR